MNMTKKLKILAIMVIIVLIFVGCSSKENGKTTSNETPESINEAGYPIVDEKITLEMMGQKSPVQPEWKEMGFFKEMEEMTNIEFNFRTATSDDFKQNKQLAFASMDLPDVFFGAEFTASEEVDY